VSVLAKSQKGVLATKKPGSRSSERKSFQYAQIDNLKLVWLQQAIRRFNVLYCRTMLTQPFDLVLWRFLNLFQMLDEFRISPSANVVI
jgi:hypothetical protein